MNPSRLKKAFLEYLFSSSSVLKDAKMRLIELSIMSFPVAFTTKVFK